MNYISGYLQMNVDEVIKESDTAFLFRFEDGEQEWFLKRHVVQSGDYCLGDRNIVVHIRYETEST